MCEKNEVKVDRSIDKDTAGGGPDESKVGGRLDDEMMGSGQSEIVGSS